MFEFKLNAGCLVAGTIFNIFLCDFKRENMKLK